MFNIIITAVVAVIIVVIVIIISLRLQFLRTLAGIHML
jgi:hypothetical protein